MSFNPNHNIGLHNYEEWLVLYMDEELTPAQRLDVEAFLLLHPHLRADLEALLSTRLPADDVTFFAGKESLLSGNMKLAAIDEALLLYVDNELPAAQQVEVSQKIASDADYALQHSLLLQTKLDATETVSYPDKTELYRREEKVRPLGIWLRVAAAVVVLLFGSLFFLQNKNAGEGAEPAVATYQPKKNTTQEPVAKDVAGKEPTKPVGKEQTVIAKNEGKAEQKKNEPIIVEAKEALRKVVAAPLRNEDLTSKQRPVIKLDASNLIGEPQLDNVVAVNEIITHTSVTSDFSERTTINEGDEETAGSDADFKQTRKTPAKGFFRKVSRFIERRTGIGTVNADNELLIGAVALKLK